MKDSKRLKKFYKISKQKNTLRITIPQAIIKWLDLSKESLIIWEILPNGNVLIQKNQDFKKIKELKTYFT